MVFAAKSMSRNALTKCVWGDPYCNSGIAFSVYTSALSGRWVGGKFRPIRWSSVPIIVCKFGHCAQRKGGIPEGRPRLVCVLHQKRRSSERDRENTYPNFKDFKGSSVIPAQKYWYPF